MAIGLLILISTGKENLYLSYNPEITFFKIAYKRYTNFSTEIIPQYFKNTPDFGRRVSVTVSKNADLLGQTYLYVKLPGIALETHSTLPSGVKKFAWIKKIGLGIVRFVDLEIGGTLIDRQYGDWINIWLELTQTKSKKRGIDKMIGDIKQLTDFSNGKDSYSVTIPLPFWFSNNYGISLPLVSLVHSDIKFHVEFNDINLCYKESPNHYLEVNNFFCLFEKNEYFTQNINGTIATAEFIYFDVKNKRLYYNKINGDFLIPETDNPKFDIIGNTSKFTMQIKNNSNIVQDESYFKYNLPSIPSSYLLANYIYLDNDERWKFMNKDHEYLIRTIQNIPEQTINSINTSIKLPIINPIIELIWRFQLQSNYDMKDIFNYTSLPLTSNNEFLAKKETLLLNSQPRTEISVPEYYTYIQSFQSHLNSSNDGIHFYSFALFPDEQQPSGTFNFSKIDHANLQLTMNKIVNYQNPAKVRIYAVQYNIFRIIDGLGGMVFTS